MKNRVYKAITIMLIMISVVVVSIPFVSADDTSGKLENGLTWKFYESTGEFVVSGNGAMEDFMEYSVEGGYKVVERPWESIHDSIETVKIDNGVTRIGDHAFCGCKELKSVTIGSDVEEIGIEAFGYCYNMESIKLADSVAVIGHRAFSYCKKLTQFTVPESVNFIGDGAFSYCENLASVSLPDSLTYIGSGVFEDSLCYEEISNWVDGCLYVGNNLIAASTVVPDNYKIREGTKCIAGAAFYGSGIMSISIPNSVVSIGDSAFGGCTDLKSIVIPDSVVNIEANAFSGCTQLADITVPDSVMRIGQYAFSNTAFFNDSSNWEGEDLYIGNHLLQVGFETSGVYTIKEGTKCIADSAFYSRKNITGVEIPDGVTSIGKEAFYECENIISIALPASVKSIGEYAFFNCYKLQNINIPEGVTELEFNTFTRCYDLRNIILPATLKVIDHAFSDNYDLENIYFAGSESEWNAISIDQQSLSNMTDINIEYNSDADVSDLGVTNSNDEIPLVGILIAIIVIFTVVVLIVAIIIIIVVRKKNINENKISNNKINNNKISSNNINNNNINSRRIVCRRCGTVLNPQMRVCPRCGLPSATNGVPQQNRPVQRPGANMMQNGVNNNINRNYKPGNNR